MPQKIHKTAIVDPQAELGDEVEIGPYAIVEANVKLGDRVRVGPHSIIKEFTTIGKDSKIFAHSVIGEIPQDLKFDGSVTYLEIGSNCVIREFVTVNRGTSGGGRVTRVGHNCMLMSYSHVAHDCQLADHVIMANAATLAGHVTIQEYAIIGGLTALHQFITIGKYSIIGGCSATSKDIIPFALASGYRAHTYGLNKIGLRRHHFPPESIDNLKRAFKILFHSKLNTSEALKKIDQEIKDCLDVDYLVKFIRSSKRGISK